MGKQRSMGKQSAIHACVVWRSTTPCFFLSLVAPFCVVRPLPTPHARASAEDLNLIKFENIRPIVTTVFATEDAPCWVCFWVSVFSWNRFVRCVHVVQPACLESLEDVRLKGSTLSSCVLSKYDQFDTVLSSITADRPTPNPFPLSQTPTQPVPS